MVVDMKGAARAVTTGLLVVWADDIGGMSLSGAPAESLSGTLLDVSGERGDETGSVLFPDGLGEPSSSVTPTGINGALTAVGTGLVVSNGDDAGSAFCSGAAGDTEGNVTANGVELGLLVASGDVTD
jgi:hypothetical protein